MGNSVGYRIRTRWSEGDVMGKKRATNAGNGENPKEPEIYRRYHASAEYYSDPLDRHSPRRRRRGISRRAFKSSAAGIVIYMRPHS